MDKSYGELSSLNMSLDMEIKTFLNNIDDEINFPIYQSKNINNNMKNILVLSGGAVKGIAFIGVLKALEVKGILDNINIYAGSSAGTIIIMLHLLGYTPDEMYEIVKNFNMDNMKCISIGNLLKDYGLDTGIKLEYVLKRLIKAKGYNENISLGELYKITSNEFILTTTCLNTKKTKYLSYKEDSELPLYKAVRMSTSIPIFYTPVEYKGMLYIDGGCMDNYPIHIFNKFINKVIGVYLVEEIEHISKINNLESCLFETINCLMHGANYNSIKGYEKYTIQINIPPINMMNYNISDNDKKQIFNAGFNQTIEFLKNK